MTKVGIITVSYLNDFFGHSEWLHPFYASLYHELKQTQNLDLIHFIIQNDQNKSNARENIKNVVSNYQFNSLNLRFLNPEIEDEFTRSPNHHARGIYKGTQKISQKIDSSEFDFFILEEFDTVHKKLYFNKVRSLNKVSRDFKSFVGKIYPGDVWKNGRNRIKNNRISIKFSRIFPHFLLFNSKLFTDFKDLSNYFESSYRNFMASKVKKISKRDSDSQPINLESDNGSDIFYKIIKNYNFMHLESIPLYHIKLITIAYRNLMKYEEDYKVDKQKNLLEKSFDDVVNKFNYLKFAKDCIFGKDKENLCKKLNKISKQ